MHDIFVVTTPRAVMVRVVGGFAAFRILDVADPIATPPVHTMHEVTSRTQGKVVSPEREARKYQFDKVRG